MLITETEYQSPIDIKQEFQYSSRMRTVRCNGRRGLYPGEGVCPGGLPGGVCKGGCLPHSPLPSACWDTPPLWTELLTHTCENITFPKLLWRTVLNKCSYASYISLRYSRNKGLSQL